MRGTTAGDLWKLCGHFLLPTLEFSEVPELLDASGFPVTSFSWLLQDSDSENSHDPDVCLLRQVSLQLCPSTRQGMHLSASLEDSTLRRVLNFFFPLHQVSLNLSIPGLFDAIGSFADEELTETVEDRFVTVGFDFATSLSSSFCSCMMFAIVLVQLIKLEFLAQQVELKLLMLNKWRRLFHSSRVKLPLVAMSASWCLVSMYLIWILGSKSIQSNN